jgi:hypothetical protein
MDGFIARANIDHYLALLNGHMASENRAMTVKLLIAEEDRMGHGWEQLEFAETRAARARNLLNELRSMLNNDQSSNRPLLEKVVANAEAIQNLLDGFCRHLRERANSGL